MKPAIPMRFLLLLLLAMFAGLEVRSQSLKHFSDSLKTVVNTYYRGDSVLISCDTVYLLNKPTFRIYRQYYQRGKNTSGSFKKVIAEYEDVIVQKDSMLSAKEAYYQALKSQFDELSGKSLAFMDKTSIGLQQVSSTLEKTTNSLIETQKLLEESRQMLIDERRKQNFKALKFGIGGLIIGGVVGLLVPN
jgi:hypothetical protein